jgi:hypothetical protein
MMGLFDQMKDMAAMVKAAPGLIDQANQLSAQASAFVPQTDAATFMAQASAAMTDASAALASMAPAATTPEQEAQRVRTSATVVAARQRPMMIGMDAVVDVDLRLDHPALASGATAASAHTLTARVGQLQLARLLPGTALTVSLVPGAPETLRIEW